jgi:alpha-L-rhamnosidase
MRKAQFFTLLVACIVLAVYPIQGRILATNLRCGFLFNPLGVDDTTPRLSWQLQAAKPAERGQSQTAFQILVATSSNSLSNDQGDLWDSGKIISDKSAGSYGGSPLVSEQQVFWKVRVWDSDGQASDWSPVATWAMGLLHPSDWLGHWICASPTNAGLPIFRREFAVEPGLQRAVIYICGLGQYELSANGLKVGDALLAPGWSKYDKTCLYDTLDLTSYLTNGNNALGVMLGNGMYNVPEGSHYAKFTGSFGVPKIMALIHLYYTNGTSAVIPTDSQWLTAPGPITFSSVYGGEEHDARLERPGWNQAGFNAAAWSPAMVTNSPGGILRGTSHAAPPIKAIEAFSPIQTNVMSLSKMVIDFGQNASLIPRLTVHGQSGAMIRLIPAELTNSDGSVNRSTVGGGACYWQYTLAGRGKEIWFPRFFYHGCRYLQVESSPAPGSSRLPVIDDLRGVVIQSASAPAGEFSCSNDLFNRVHTLIRWAQRNNLVSVITDCPHRERLGWLEQYHLHGPSLRYEFDLAQFYAKSMGDMADSQLASGLVPDIAPEYPIFRGGFRASPEWGSSFVIVPWQQYQFTGDDTLLRRYYPNMSRYVAYLKKSAFGYILNYGLGDWYDLGPKPPGYAQLTPASLTASAYFYQDAEILAQAAALLGKTNDLIQFNTLAANICTAFNRSFYSATNGFYATGSQTAQSLPLVLGMVNSTNRASVTAALVANVRSNGLTAGDIGHRYLLRALADAGRSDVIFDLHSQTNKPGYGYILGKGATALTESWDGSNSQDHFMLGHIMEWFYADLAGIACDPAGPGFKKIIIRPQPVGDVTWVKASYNSAAGRIASNWKTEDGKFALHLEIPINTTATVYLPARNREAVFESGQHACKAPGVHFVSQETNCVVYEVKSGSYEFVFSPPAKAPVVLTEGRCTLK